MNHSSRPVNIPEKPSTDGRHSLLKSRSPGDFSVLDQRKENNKLENCDEDQERKLNQKILEFTFKEAKSAIQDVIQKEFSGNCRLGDVKLGLVLQAHLAQLKIASLNLTSDPDVERKENEDPITYKIRSNPVMRNKIDQKIFELALSINETRRTSQSK
jgi:hypothetical protein